MTLESVFALVPPLVREGNKDTQNDGEFDRGESAEETDPRDSKNASEEDDKNEDVDLEEGEIIDSDEEEEEEEVENANGANKEEKTKSSNDNSLGDAPEIAEENGEQADPNVVLAKKKKRKKKKKQGTNDEADGDDEEEISGKPKKKVSKYIDHDKIDDNKMWFYNCDSPVGLKRRHGFGNPSFEGPGPFDTPEYSPDYRRSQWESPNAYSENSGEEMDNPEERIRRPPTIRGRKKMNDKLGRKKRKGGIPGGPDSKKMKLGGRGGIRGKKKEGKQKGKSICKFFLDGKCTKGSDCPFSHNVKPLKKKKLCKFYLNGYCARGDACVYMHGEFPCKFFHTGAKCYSDENCRFSHKPLTPEMKKILDEYLEKDDGVDHNGGSGPEDPGRKRPSLLGSPPRHVRQGMETWKWQQQMIQMEQQRGKGKNLFHIDRSMVACPPGPASPTHPEEPMKPIPNFYVETLQESPLKEPLRASSPIGGCSPPTLIPQNQVHSDAFLGFPSDSELFAEAQFPNVNVGMPGGNPEFMQEPEIVQDSGFPVMPVLLNNALEDSQGKIGRSDNALPSEGESAPDLLALTPLSPTSIPLQPSGWQQQPLNVSKVESVEESGNSQPPQSPERSQSPPSSTPIVFPPISIPSHLPRKQRELYLRIQHNQKEAANRARQLASLGDGEAAGNQSLQVEEKIEAMLKKEKEEQWYSSDDDDDDDDDSEDQPLTDVLKKLQQVLPAQSPSTVSNKLSESRSTKNSTSSLDLLLSTIQRQVSQNSAESTKSSIPQDSIWQTILSNVNVQRKAAEAPKPTVTAPIPSVRDPRLRTPSSGVQVSNTDTATTTSGPQIEASIVMRDPRLQGRAMKLPLTCAKDTKPTGVDARQPVGGHDNLSETPARDETNGCVISSSGSGAAVPYKLHAVSASHPNYAPYLFGSHSNPNLLNDPRIKKKLSNAQQIANALLSEQCVQLPELPVNDAPASSPGQTFQPNKEAQIHPEQKVPKVADPRLARTATGDPRLVRVQTNKLQPSSSPPLPISIQDKDPRLSATAHHSSLPAIVSSHPPSAADPRLARHSNSAVEERRQGLPQRKMKKPSGNHQGYPNSNLPLPLPTSMPSVTTTANTTTSVLSSTSNHGKQISNPEVTIPRKPERADPRLLKHSQASESREKGGVEVENVTKIVSVGKENSSDENKSDSTIKDKDSKVLKSSTNRKSTMDYSSPLSSYEDTNSSTLYSGYNRRPQARNPATLKAPSVPTSIPQPPASIPPPEVRQDAAPMPFMPTDLIGMEQNEQAPSSLKDMFKTIDPTASPFC